MDLAREEDETEIVNLLMGKASWLHGVRPNAVAQWHSRWECPWMKHGETAGTGGDENMKGVGIV